MKKRTVTIGILIIMFGLSFASMVNAAYWAPGTGNQCLVYNTTKDTLYFSIASNDHNLIGNQITVDLESVNNIPSFDSNPKMYISPKISLGSDPANVSQAVVITPSSNTCSCDDYIVIYYSPSDFKNTELYKKNADLIPKGVEVSLEKLISIFSCVIVIKKID